jgi:hypothetical protein
LAVGCAGEAPEAIELGETAQEWLGTKVINSGGTIVAGSGTKLGSDPNKCRPNVSETCYVPWQGNVCVYNMQQFGTSPSPATPAKSTWIGDKCEDGCEDMTIVLDFDGDGGQQCGTSFSYTKVRFVEGAVDSTNWQGWNETWMHRVLRVTCKGWSSLTDSYSATWRKCNLYEAKIDRARLTTWAGNQGLSVGHVENRVLGYIYGQISGLGEDDRLGYMYDRLNKGTVQAINHYAPIDKLMLDHYWATTPANVIELDGTIQVFN